ncbi:DEAD/DEAH box helicase [Reticulomyxa filosa]|uniref:DEAD/DEAH box helicase n=1 Tax=Reticulomyxa filosa TaxID=46433 RepID=X6MPK0_RETFI|nr:DEAD/DEAH box helicase [Reticulomyxa filosa]|eukprot:ETO15784.1 DEAD/DEAH box helicase [Reticulomyxa filosa]
MALEQKNTEIAKCHVENISKPTVFPFPYTPYPPQQQLMECLYRTLTDGGVAILSSPTGTGKSLSIICSSLHWLLSQSSPAHTNKTGKAKESHTHSPNHKKISPKKKPARLDDDLLDQQKKKEKFSYLSTFCYFSIKDCRQYLQKKLEILEQYEQLERNAANKKRRYNHTFGYSLLFSWFNGEGLPAGGTNQTDTKNRSVNEWMVCSSVIYLFIYFFATNQKTFELEARSQKKKKKTPQIIYCSRTHSQLQQFIKEIRKTKFKDDQLEIVHLGSRKQLCVNDDINQKQVGVEHINEKCLEMQQSASVPGEVKIHAKNKKAATAKGGESTKISAAGQKNEAVQAKKRSRAQMENEAKHGANEAKKKGKKQSKCPYLNDRIEQFSLMSTLEMHDIEQCFELGKKMNACAYYGIRKNVATAHLIVAPYNLLIQESARESLGIQLKDNVVIIDEAHNLIETINATHTFCVTLQTLQLAHDLVKQYFSKYENRFKFGNAARLKQLLKVLEAFLHYLGESGVQDKSTAFNGGSFTAVVVNGDDMLFDMKIDHMNFYELTDFVEQHNLVKKLHGFAISNVIDNAASLSRTKSPLASLTNLLKSLMNKEENGAVIVTKYSAIEKRPQNELKYILLNPDVHFKRIVDECRSVVLAGGTMQPTSHFVQQLFHHIPAEKVHVLSCDHVVPQDHVLAVTLKSGPSNVKFDFTFKNRCDTKMLNELGRSIINIAKVVMGGMVLFFNSFDYMDLVLKHWKQHLANLPVKKKKNCSLRHFIIVYEPFHNMFFQQTVFVESHSSADVEPLLLQYKECIYPLVENKDDHETSKTSHGAILICVVGGKMSEGINFQDDLCRCVIMCGLPYANKNDIELKQRMEYLNKKLGNDAGNKYYQNLCMRAVNQSIGRAIRHKDDFGAIVLIDQRYSERDNIINDIPLWIQRSLYHATSFGDCFHKITKFVKHCKSLYCKEKEK